MKKKLSKVLTLVFMMASAIFIMPICAKASILPEPCPTCNSNVGQYYETTDTTYVNANDVGHQRKTKYAFICIYGHGWTNYYYFNEPHYTPQNNPCVCGFVPHRNDEGTKHFILE